MFCRAHEKTAREQMIARCGFGVLQEAPPGFEPGNDGFAIRCLSHLATAPSLTGYTELIGYSDNLLKSFCVRILEN